MTEEKKLQVANGKLEKAIAKMEVAQGEVYALMSEIYRLKGRCYPCEQHGGMEQGQCSSFNEHCLRPIIRELYKKETYDQKDSRTYQRS
jgi:hypothetical protein